MKSSNGQLMFGLCGGYCGACNPSSRKHIPLDLPVLHAEPANFVILHYGGKCASINSVDRLYLIVRCTTRSILTSDKYRKHLASGSCVVPESHYSGAGIRLQRDCGAANTRYKQTKMYSIKHISSSGKCWHPQGGSFRPSEGTEVAHCSGCDQSRLRFKFETVPPPKPVNFIISHFCGKCVSINSIGRLRLTTACTTILSLTSSKLLKHLASGKCIVPESHRNGARIRLQANCNDAITRYEQTRMYSTVHIPTGKCWHPQGESSRPSWGTEVILHSGFDESRLRFRFDEVFPGPEVF